MHIFMKKAAGLVLAAAVAMGIAPAIGTTPLVTEARAVENSQFNVGMFGVYVLMYGGGENNGYFSAGQNPSDQLVFEWTKNRNGLSEGEVTYDKFIKMADDAFVTHSDLKDYLKENSGKAGAGFTFDGSTIKLSFVGGGGDSVYLSVESDDTKDGTGTIHCAWRDGEQNDKLLQDATISLQGGAIASFTKGYSKVEAKTDSKADSKTNIKPVKKSANPLKIKVATKSIKASALKKAKKSFSIGATKAQGKVTYTLDAKAKKAKIKVSSKGKVTVPKKCKKGTYKITVKAAGNSKYKAGKKTVKVVVK